MMTKAQLKAILAEADAKGMPEDAAITVNGANLNGSARLNLGQFLEPAGGQEEVVTPPSIDLVQ